VNLNGLHKRKLDSSIFDKNLSDPGLRHELGRDLSNPIIIYFFFITSPT